MVENLFIPSNKQRLIGHWIRFSLFIFFVLNIFIFAFCFALTFLPNFDLSNSGKFQIFIVIVYNNITIKIGKKNICIWSTIVYIINLVILLVISMIFNQPFIESISSNNANLIFKIYSKSTPLIYQNINDLLNNYTLTGFILIVVLLSFIVFYIIMFLLSLMISNKTYSKIDNTILEKDLNKYINVNVYSGNFTPNKEHIIVPLNIYGNNSMSYEERKACWEKHAGINNHPEMCFMCKSLNNVTIKLENNNHICYECWMKNFMLNHKSEIKKYSKNLRRLNNKGMTKSGKRIEEIINNEKQFIDSIKEN